MIIYLKSRWFINFNIFLRTPSSQFQSIFFIILFQHRWGEISPHLCWNLQWAFVIACCSSSACRPRPISWVIHVYTKLFKCWATSLFKRLKPNRKNTLRTFQNVHHKHFANTWGRVAKLVRLYQSGNNRKNQQGQLPLNLAKKQP